MVHRPPPHSEFVDPLYDDAEANTAETKPDSEYATPTTNSHPQSSNQMPSLYYTTVVRQDGQKVSVKIKA